MPLASAFGPAPVALSSAAGALLLKEDQWLHLIVGSVLKIG